MGDFFFPIVAAFMVVCLGVFALIACKWFKEKGNRAP